nr:hypothetical protein [Tanacetum cinerariifolium]
MAVRVSLAMSPGLSASIAKVAAMSNSAFRKRFRSSNKSLPLSSSPDLLSRKRSRGTSELVEDDEEEDEEVEEGSDPDSESEDVKDEGPVAGDEGLATEDDGPNMRVESLGLGGDEVVPETPPSPEWSSSSLPVSPAPFIVPLPISSHMIPLTVPSTVASPITAETEEFLTELGAQVEMQGWLIHDHTVRLGELSPVLFKRYDRDIWELFTRSGAIIEERRARLDLVEIVDSMRRGQEPRGDA